MKTTIYHVSFATKRRTWLLQGDIEQAARHCLLQIARDKRIEVLECETVVNHVHLLLQVGEDEKLSKVMNLLKGASSHQLHRAFPELKLDSGLDRFWQRGYGFSVVEPGSLPTRRRYVRTQEERLDSFEERTTMPRSKGRGVEQNPRHLARSRGT